MKHQEPAFTPQELELIRQEQFEKDQAKTQQEKARQSQIRHQQKCAQAKVEAKNKRDQALQEAKLKKQAQQEQDRQRSRAQAQRKKLTEEKARKRQVVQVMTDTWKKHQSANLILLAWLRYKAIMQTKQDAAHMIQQFVLKRKHRQLENNFQQAQQSSNGLVSNRFMPTIDITPPLTPTLPQRQTSFDLSAGEELSTPSPSKKLGAISPTTVATTLLEVDLDKTISFESYSLFSNTPDHSTILRCEQALHSLADYLRNKDWRDELDQEFYPMLKKSIYDLKNLKPVQPLSLSDHAMSSLLDILCLHQEHPSQTMISGLLKELCSIPHIGIQYSQYFKDLALTKTIEPRHRHKLEHMSATDIYERMIKSLDRQQTNGICARR